MMVVKRWWVAAGLAFAMAGNVSAGVDNGSNGGELVLYLWDPVAEVSYAKDLGISMDAFFVSGQQDAGVQQFWQLAGANDASFSAFRAVSTAANTRWALFGFDGRLSLAEEANGLYGQSPGANRIFTTLTNTATAGVNGAAYNALHALDTNNFWIHAGNTASEILWLSENPGRAGNTHTVDWQQNGSSFDVKGTRQYFDADGGIFKELGGVGTTGITATNRLGESSWFYAVTNPNDYDSFAPVAVDEFDNLGHDAYWGLALDPATNNYVLSYTLAAYSQSAMSFSPIGTARAAVTEYLASTGDRLLDTPDGVYDGYVPIDLSPVPAVPEPAACLLFGAGALALIARRRALKVER